MMNSNLNNVANATDNLHLLDINKTIDFYLADISKQDYNTQIYLQILSITWLSSLVNILLTCALAVGIVMYFLNLNKARNHPGTSEWVGSDLYAKPKIHIRYVTKGTNQQQIIESCVYIQESISLDSLWSRAEWSIEVLSDQYINLGPAEAQVTQIVVPDDQKTPMNSLFKARALHYAAKHHIVDSDAWILHMDEESQFNSKNGHKIVDHIDNENQLIKQQQQQPSFANGYIVYTKQDTPDSMFWTFVDVMRIGDDHIKMSWSFTHLNRCCLGIKGSNWLIHSEIERQIGFDVRQNRSIGEDWIVSLNFNQHGQPIKWMDATIEEQSPFSLNDQIKQRNRWQKANLHNALNSVYDYTFPLHFMLYYLTMIYYFCPVVFLSIIFGFINSVTVLIHQLDYDLFKDSYIPQRLFPIIKDDWQFHTMQFSFGVQQIFYLVGQQNSGFDKQDRVTQYGCWALMLISAGMTLSVQCEMITIMNFIFFVDKKTLEFRVIDKNSKQDKLNLRNDLNIPEQNDNLFEDEFVDKKYINGNSKSYITNSLGCEEYLIDNSIKSIL